jgi:hypothetical protein
MTLADFMDDIVWERRHTTYPVVHHGGTVGLLPVPPHLVLRMGYRPHVRATPRRPVRDVLSVETVDG